MDLFIAAFFLLISFLGVLLGYLFKNPGLGGLGAIGFLLTGFAFLLTGLDTQVQTSMTSNFTSTDLYLYNWNSTFNQSSIANVSTTLNKTITQRYNYVNETTEYTRLFALLSIFIGLATGFAAWGSRQKEEPKNE